MKVRPTTPLIALLLGPAVAAPAAHAQQAPQGGAEGEEAGTPGVTVVQVPSQPAPPPVVVGGYPQGDPNEHLPSSARGTTDTSRSTDGFDLNPRGAGPASVRGSSGGSYVQEGQFVPEAHSVRRGDTLWDISGRYYQNPYSWPQLWAMNPQIQNPHWIYPGDRVRLRDSGEGPTLGDIGTGPGGGQRRVPPKTLFLRELGWVDDREEDTWGKLLGSPDDQMLLSEGDDVYVQLEEGHPISVGQSLQIFRPIKTVGSGKAKGELVRVLGSARVERYNPKTRMVRAKIVESLDVIERGARVGPVLRRMDVVPPAANQEKDVVAKILATIYPYQLVGQWQVVFIDKGEKDGVKPGQRFFAVRRGDRWVESLRGAGQMATVRSRVEDERPAQVEKMEYGVDEDLLPDETYAELRVMTVRDHTAAALVTVAMHEIERDAVLISKKGF